MYKFSVNRKFSEKMIKQIKQNCYDLQYSISYDLDLTEVLPKASVLITEYSIVAVEASFNEIPVIISDFFRTKDDILAAAYENEGIAIRVKNMEDLFDNINKILYDEDAKKEIFRLIKKFNYRYNYLNDGNATKRVYDVLTK